jgi:hypothetical protein
MVELAHRSFLTGMIAFGVTAPAIVRAGSLMPVKSYLVVNHDDIAELLARLDDRGSLFDHQYAERYGLPILGEINPQTRQVIRLH